MARAYAPIYTSIWKDHDFTALTERAQRVYLLAVSQPNVSYCGVVPYTAKRWARLASNTSPAQVSKAIAELEGAGFVLLDTDTEELWIRSFVRHNAVLRQPQIKKAMEREFEEVHSEPIRSAFLASLPDEYEGTLRAACPQPDGTLPEGWPTSDDEDEGKGFGFDDDDQPSSSSHDDERLTEVWSQIADRRLRDQQNRGTAIANRPAWLAKVAANERESSWERAAKLCADYAPDQLPSSYLARVLCGEESILRHLERRPPDDDEFRVPGEAS